LECLKCNPTCSTCSGSENNCISCDSTMYLVSGKCETSCPPQYWEEASVKICKPCNPSCRTCTNAEKCTTCQTDYYMRANEQICYKCPSPCQTCSSDTKCESCIEDYFLSSTSCGKECPNGYWGN
jgi:proprotein convertase subtilisin/kexin type 5